MTTNNSNSTLDYLQQLQVLGSVNTVDRDLWKSQNAQTADLINHSDKLNYANEYRGNRSFDYLNSHITDATSQGIAAVERNGTANLVAGERNAGFLNAQNERIAAMLGNQSERIGASGIATTEKVGTALSQQNERIGTALGSQAERIHNDTTTQVERVGAGLNVQSERIGAGLGVQGERVLNTLNTQAERIANQSSVQNERIANQLGFQTERVANQLGIQNERIHNDATSQNERISSDLKTLLNGNFTETLSGLHDIRARNTDNFAKTWVEQEKSNTLSYRNTADLARLALDHSGKAAVELQKVEMGLGKLAMEQANQAMRLNLEQFAKMQIDAAKTEAALSKQASENTFHLSKQLSGTEEKILDRMNCIDKDRLRDKAYLGAARGLVLDEYHHRNFHAGQDPYWHHHGHHHHRRSHSHSRSPSPRRRRGRRDDDDTRINVVTNIRDNNELDSRIRNGAGAAAIV